MPISNLSHGLHEEISLLAHAIEGDTFHFAVVQWGHYAQIERVQSDLLQTFPERPALRLHCKAVATMIWCPAS
ncbi:MAG: hypothetical protein R2795_07845 [Saprospiraceae bacterium]